MTNVNLKVGDILTSSWGYDQTNVDFYQVVKLSKCFVELMPIEGKVTSYDDCYMDTVIPVPGQRLQYWNNDPEPIIRRKISSGDTTGKNEVYIRISSCQYARPWNGMPRKQTNSMNGH